MKIQDILEKQIASLSKRLSVDVALAIDQSAHGEERRYRHVDDEGNEGIIGHSEIVNTVSKALPKIMQLVVDGDIANKASLVLYNSQNDLNVVGELDLKSDTFKVITIMRKKNFVAKPGDKKIEV